MMLQSCSHIADDTEDVLSADYLFSDQEIYDEFPGALLRGGGIAQSRQ